MIRDDGMDAQYPRSFAHQIVLRGGWTWKTEKRRPYHRATLLRTSLDETYFWVRAATPGSTFPSRNSNEAPPPVEICDMRSASPA